MILISLPDCKDHHKFLTLGKDYEIIKEIGTNGVLIQSDDPELKLILLKERFKNETTSY